MRRARLRFPALLRGAWRVAMVGMLTLACGGSQTGVSGPGASGGTLGDPRPSAPSEILAFEQQVINLNASAPGWEAALIRSLAAAVEALPGEKRAIAKPLSRLRGHAAALEASQTDGVERTAHVKAGLVEAITALKTFNRALPVDAPQGVELQRAQAATNIIVLGEPLSQQLSKLHTSLKALARALVLAGGGQPTIQAVPQASPEWELKAASPEEHVARVRALVHELASSSWDDAPPKAAHALRAMADALAASAAGDKGVGAAVVAVRFETQRLESADVLYRMKPLTAALSAAIDGLEQLQQARKLEGLASWIWSARRALDRVQAFSSFQFQRTAIQDAFRSASAALAATLSAKQGAVGTDEQRGQLDRRIAPKATPLQSSESNSQP